MPSGVPDISIANFHGLGGCRDFCSYESFNFIYLMFYIRIIVIWLIFMPTITERSVKLQIMTYL